MRSRFLAATIVVILLQGGCGPQDVSPTKPSARPVKPAAAAKPAHAGIQERLDRVCGRLADSLLAKVPKGESVAVLPLVDSDGGIRRLGVILAAGLERKLLAAGVKMVDRRGVNALLAEKRFQVALLAQGKNVRAAGRLAGADVLVVGDLAAAESEVLVSARALNVKTGALLAAADTATLPAADLGELMWYVRRPSQAPPSGDLPPLTLRYEFVSPDGRASQEVRLGEGSTVRNGQKFKIRVQPNSDCYLYVLLYDSRGEAGVLFPHREIGMSNQVRGGVSYEIPEAAKWYWFDAQPGIETFYLVASYTPLSGLDEILAKMERAAGKKVQLARAARERIETVITRGLSPATAQDYQPKGFTITRGVGGIVDVGHTGGAATDTREIDSVVQGHATVVKKMTLRHR